MAGSVVIGLSAVVIAILDGEAALLVVHPHPALSALPSGPFDPIGTRTFELALRAFVTEQTGFDLGYVEQLYTFGDEGRDAPLADLGAAHDPDGDRIVSVGYLALAPNAENTASRAGAEWSPWTRFFPWEDWRRGRPALIDDHIAPALRAWAGGGQRGEQRWARARLLFALDGARWNEERVLDRYELLYEAGLAPEAERDRKRARGLDPPEPAGFHPGLGEPMASDHRRILATGLARMRGKLKYRPVVFELMQGAFTLSALQRTVEAIAGVALHKQNFRRMVERTGLVEGLGKFDEETGGRPAELFRFRREVLSAAPVSGLSLPRLSEG
jgi:hypothetical protein